MMYKRLFLVLYLSLSSLFLKAQKTYKMMDSENQEMNVLGTSTLHKWTMTTKKLNGGAKFGFIPGRQKQIAAVESLTMSLEVNSLKSKDKGLDKNAYKALKTDQFKSISYTLTAATVKSGNNNRYKIATTGNLEIAGVKNKIYMDVYCTVNDDATVTCTGTDALKMSDYNVKPPSSSAGNHWTAQLKIWKSGGLI